MSSEELKYFFSYTREDSEFVLKLAKELRTLGANLWLDQLDILGGQHWDRSVEKALKSCKGMIAVLSPESVASDNVMDEVSYALDEGKLVVPILIRSCDIPFRLRRVQYIDFTEDYEKGFSKLLSALRIEQPVQPPESAATQEPVVRESSLPKQSEPTPDAHDHLKPTCLETEKTGSKNQKTMLLAAICVITLIVIISIGIYLKYSQPNGISQPKTYNLTATAIDGSVTKSPDKASYNDGETVTLEAIPNKEYSFTNWSGDLSGSTNPATITINSNKSITANFAAKTYNLTATAIDGSVTKSPDKASYNDGETVTLEAIPKTGYNFINWSGDLSGSDNPTTLVMDTDKSVIASFAIKTYSINVTAVHGSVAKSPNQTSYKHGETVTLKAAPNEGYHFTSWSGDLSGSSNPTTLAMNADKSVTAIFDRKQGEFIPLFNGKDLSGWKANENQDTFSVRDGIIVVEGERSHLFYVGEVENANFKNFEFKADVMTKPGANGGVYFHTACPRTGWPSKGHEAQIDNTGDDAFDTGSLWGIIESTGSLPKDNEWFTIHIVVWDRWITIKVNGETKVGYIEPENFYDPNFPGRKLSSGTFALQGFNPESTLYYKNIMVKPLPSEPSADDARKQAEAFVLRWMRALQREDVETLVQLSPPPLFVNMNLLTSEAAIREMYQGYFENDKALRKHGSVHVDRIISATIGEYKDSGHLEEDDPLLSKMHLDDDDIVVTMIGQYEDGKEIRASFYLHQLDGRVKMAGFEQAPPPIIGPNSPPYKEDFNNGQAQGWDLKWDLQQQEGWRILREGGNYVLNGASGADGYFARYTKQSWQDFRMRFRLRLLSRTSTVHFNYRLSNKGRYYIGFQAGQLYLSKDHFTRDVKNKGLQVRSITLKPSTWHIVEIAAEGPHIQVFVDGKDEFNYTDLAPLLVGGAIAFEITPNAVVEIDDIVIEPL
jgi:hypothetical protein